MLKMSGSCHLIMTEDNKNQIHDPAILFLLGYVLYVTFL